MSDTEDNIKHHGLMIRLFPIEAPHSGKNQAVSKVSAESFERRNSTRTQSGGVDKKLITAGN